MVENDDFIAGNDKLNEPVSSNLNYDPKMTTGGFGEEKLSKANDEFMDRNMSDGMRAGGKNSSGNITQTDTFELETAGPDDTGTSNDLDWDTDREVPTMGSHISHAKNVDMNLETAQPGADLTAASTRFGDEFSESDNAILAGKSIDTAVEDEASKVSARFGEELGSMERNLYPADLVRPSAADDLTDDNDALTDRSGKTTNLTSDNANEDKKLWEKIKDKAEDIGEGIKKAFD